ncbi:MAG: HD-GYP domain-containing protein [Nitrospirae bacterium]|nr:HD-GYP domain-containing protein [Nitrospirota bacterium]MBF0535143.1 HD-GYP domain-containing protein [Nitrospirota bacterium]MBF0615238.1 HD-GYP domain-containing protein [Nitrospirota bacterium]
MAKTFRTQKSIHLKLIIRLTAGWIILSLILGAIVFFIKLESIDELVTNLAERESKPLVHDKTQLEYLNCDKAECKQSLANSMHKHIEMGHFIVVELYDRNKKKVVEVMSPDAVTVERYEKAANREHAAHQFRDTVSYKRLYVSGTIFLQVFVPLKGPDGSIAGYFEGIYKVGENTMKAIVDLIVGSLLLVVICVFATTAILYPIIIVMNKDLIKLSTDLSEANIGMLVALGSAIAKRDSDTNIHNYRVTIYSVKLGEIAGLSKDNLRSLIKGSFLHDIGKIAISDNILLKPGKLTDDEFEIMKTHVHHGVDIVGKYTWLRDSVDVVQYHHEKLDGSGYLSGLSGDSIPFNARIFAIADVFDALTSKRPYKEPFTYEHTVSILESERLTHFDPILLDLFLKISKNLYDSFCKAEDSFLEDYLNGIIKKYF